MGHALVSHLVDGHTLDYTDVVNHSVAWRNGAHDDLHQVRPSVADALSTFVTDPEAVAHEHVGYWPRGEEARQHLVNAHGWDSVRALGHTLTGAELEHHTLHQPVPASQSLIKRMKTRDTHPINVLVQHTPTIAEADTVSRQRILAGYHAEVIQTLRNVEEATDATWVLLDNDGIEVILNHLEEVERARGDVQYDAAVGIASDLDKLLGVHQ